MKVKERESDSVVVFYALVNSGLPVGGSKINSDDKMFSIKVITCEGVMRRCIGIERYPQFFGVPRIPNFVVAPLPVHVRCKRRAAAGAVCALEIRLLIANYCTRCRCIFKVLSPDGGRTDFSKNRRTSLFNDNLSNKPYFQPDSSPCDFTFKGTVAPD